LTKSEAFTTTQLHSINPSILRRPQTKDASLLEKLKEIAIPLSEDPNARVGFFAER
jgi:hypothetical protein